MKKSSLIVLLASLFLVSAASSAYADNIGLLDMEKLFSNYTEGKQIQVDLQKRRQEYQKEVEGKQKLIEDAKKDKKSDDEVKKMIEKVEGELRPKQEELLQYEAEVQGRLVSKIKEITKSVSKKYGIDVVIDRRAAYVGGFDLTDFVVEKLNGGGAENPATKTPRKR
jgi:Skp family chaperone for outer membrane proteins